MGSSSLKQLVVLVTILLATNPFDVRAERSRKIKLYNLEKAVEVSEDLSCYLKIAEFREGVVKVSGNIQQHVSINNDWKIHFTVSRADGKDEEFEEFLDLPDLGVCDVMKSYYKEFIYDSIKHYSNAPRPNTCPLPPAQYQMEDFPMDVHLLKKLLIPGYYRIVARLLHDGHIKLEYMAELEME